MLFRVALLFLFLGILSDVLGVIDVAWFPPGVAFPLGAACAATFLGFLFVDWYRGGYGKQL